MAETLKKDFTDQSQKIKPNTFLDTVLWNDWEPRLKAYLDLVSGTTIISLYYAIRDSVATVSDPTGSILNQYVLMDPHHRTVYQ